MKIDGVRCIKEIAKEVDIDPDLVARCVRNLCYYGIVSLLPLFMYCNNYVATERLHDFYSDKKLAEVTLPILSAFFLEKKHKSQMGCPEGNSKSNILLHLLTH